MRENRNQLKPGQNFFYLYLPFFESFFTAGSWEKGYKIRCSYKFFWPFLFCDGFRLYQIIRSWKRNWPLFLEDSILYFPIPTSKLQFQPAMDIKKTPIIFSFIVYYILYSFEPDFTTFYWVDGQWCYIYDYSKASLLSYPYSKC